MDVIAITILELIPTKRQKKAHGALSIFFSIIEKISLIGSPEVKPFINR